MSALSPDSRVLAVLPDLLDALAAQASTSTVLQRQWAINQAVEFYAWNNSVKADLNTLTRVRLHQILDPTAVADYLAAAETGRLRTRTPRGDRTTTESSRTTAARAAALRWLANHTALPAPAAIDPDLQLIEPTQEMADHLRRAVHAWTSTDTPAVVRAAAAAAITASTALSSQQLVRLTLDDIENTSHSLVMPARNLEPRPHNFVDDEHPRARILPWGMAAVRSWLKHRRHLVEQLDGSDPGTLFLTCRTSKPAVPPGMPLSLRALTAAHTAAVKRLEVTEPQLNPPATLSTVRRVALAQLLRP